MTLVLLVLLLEDVAAASVASAPGYLVQEELGVANTGSIAVDDDSDVSAVEAVFDECLKLTDEPGVGSATSTSTEASSGVEVPSTEKTAPIGIFCCRGNSQLMMNEKSESRRAQLTFDDSDALQEWKRN